MSAGRRRLHTAASGVDQESSSCVLPEKAEGTPSGKHPEDERT